MLRAAGRGALAGLAWGLLARLFMRLISTTPEFTWSGTLLILGFSTVLGLGLGLVVGARHAGRSRWWRLAPVPGLVLFASPGLTLVPGAVLVAVALAVRSLLVKGLLLLLAVVAVVVPSRGIDVDAASTDDTSLAGWVGLGLVLVAVALLGVGFHEWWRRWVPAGRHTPVDARSETRV